MVVIESIHARQIFDSRGNPTVEVDLKTAKGKETSIFRNHFIQCEKQDETNSANWRRARQNPTNIHIRLVAECWSRVRWNDWTLWPRFTKNTAISELVLTSVVFIVKT